MGIVVFLFVAIFVSVESSIPVPDDCMNCIRQVESNCTLVGCVLDALGPYQIKEPYYTDALTSNPNLGSGWQSCPMQLTCGEDTVQAYMTRYATYSRLGHNPTCEDFARIHNGGPNGFSESDTDGYWSKVSACLN